MKLCAALFAFLVWPTLAEARVAFVGIDGLGLERTVVEPIEQLVEAELSRIARGDLITPVQVKARLAERGLERLRHCGGDFTCLVDLGGVTEADVVIYGTLTQLGENHVIVLRGIDVLESRELPRIRENLTGAGDELVASIRGAATRLLAIERYRGQLDIKNIAASATVEVDGIAVPFSGEPLEVSVGQHTVTISAPNRQTFTAMVDVGYDEIAYIDGSLDSISASFSGGGFVSQWWPAIAIGAGALSLGGSAALGYFNHQAELDYRQAFKQNSRAESFFQDTKSRGETYALWSNITLGVGLALVSAGVLGWLLDDDGEVEP